MGRPSKYGFDTEVSSIRIRKDLKERARLLNLNLSELVNELLERVLSRRVSSIEELELRLGELKRHRDWIERDIEELEEKIRVLRLISEGRLEELPGMVRRRLVDAVGKIRRVYQNHFHSGDRDDAVGEVARFWSMRLKMDGIDIDADTLLGIALRKKEEKKGDNDG